MWGLSPTVYKNRSCSSPQKEMKLSLDLNNMTDFWRQSVINLLVSCLVEDPNCQCVDAHHKENAITNNKWLSLGYVGVFVSLTMSIEIETLAMWHVSLKWRRIIVVRGKIILSTQHSQSSNIDGIMTSFHCILVLKSTL